jgi:hypothetical protein
LREEEAHHPYSDTLILSSFGQSIKSTYSSMHIGRPIDIDKKKNIAKALPKA